MRLFIAAVDYSTPAEVFQVAQQLEELPAVVNGFESDIDVWHFIFQRQEEALKSSVSSQNSTVMNQNKKKLEKFQLLVYFVRTLTNQCNRLSKEREI